MKEKFEILFDKERLIGISQELQKEHFKPGYDNMTAEGSETWLEINYDNLFAQLKSGSYRPLPLSGFSVLNHWSLRKPQQQLYQPFADRQ